MKDADCFFCMKGMNTPQNPPPCSQFVHLAIPTVGSIDGYTIPPIFSFTKRVMQRDNVQLHLWKQAPVGLHKVLQARNAGRVVFIGSKTGCENDEIHLNRVVERMSRDNYKCTSLFDVVQCLRKHFSPLMVIVQPFVLNFSPLVSLSPVFLRIL